MFYRVQFDENNIAVILYDSSAPFEEAWDNCLDITEEQKSNLIMGVTTRNELEQG